MREDTALVATVVRRDCIPDDYGRGTLAHCQKRLFVTVLSTFAPVCSRFVFYRRSTAIVPQVANLLILRGIEYNNNTLEATIAVKVT